MRPLSPGTLTLAYATDLALGDPVALPHPVRFMGRLISLGERRLKPGQDPRSDAWDGAALSILVVAVSWTAGWLSALAPLPEVVMAWTTLATGSLLAEAGGVAKASEANDLPKARLLLARIVGRDTGALDEGEIARAIIETLAESLCDGVIAPLFFLALGGLPFAMAYKAINTLDSMVGHPEPPYTHFGRFAARLDDLANFIPARMSAFSIVAAAGLCRCNYARAFRIWLADGHKHPSPNAGQSEAAMAGALGVQLGGTNYYAGKPLQRPLLGSGLRVPGLRDVRQAIRLTRVTSMLVFAATLAYCWRRRYCR